MRACRNTLEACSPEARHHARGDEDERQEEEEVLVRRDAARAVGSAMPDEVYRPVRTARLAQSCRCAAVPRTALDGRETHGGQPEGEDVTDDPSEARGALNTYGRLGRPNQCGAALCFGGFRR